ncbi:hypothetical protein Q8F55_001526 [Vanrija albida]|uniref:Uncharacterized protein n=1 Tax=Vanrija albida TaxID=181172 RepID=A0ABR3QGB4_9TREE
MSRQRPPPPPPPTSRWTPINVPPNPQLPTPAPSTASEPEERESSACTLVRASAAPLAFPCNQVCPSPHPAHAQWKFFLLRNPLSGAEIDAVFANAERTLRAAGGGCAPGAAPLTPVSPYAISVRNGLRQVDLGRARGIVRVRFAAPALEQVVLELLGRGIERACGVASEDSDSEDEGEAEAFWWVGDRAG